MNLEDEYLKQNDFVLLSTSPSDYYVLRVLDAEPIPIDYFPQVDINGFLPLNAYQGDAVSGQFNKYVVDSQQLAMQEFTNITNIFDADNMDYAGTNTLMQVFMGIAPSALRVFRYIPSQDAVGNYLNGNKVHWGAREQKYNIGYVDGFRSPKNNPTYSGEFFVPPVSSMLFTFMNPSSIPMSPEIKFYINQMIVEPVSDLNLATKILNRIVPARRASIGAFNQGLGKKGKSMFGVSSIPLDASQTDLNNAGYGGA